MLPIRSFNKYYGVWRKLSKTEKTTLESHKVKEKFRTAIMLKKPDLNDFEIKIKNIK